TAALALVFIQNDLVEAVAQDFRLAAQVFIAPVAGAADDGNPALGRQLVDRADQRLHCIRVVAVVGDDRGAVPAETVEASGRGLRIVDEARQSRRYLLP